MALPEEEILIAAAVAAVSSPVVTVAAAVTARPLLLPPSLPLRNPENDNIAVARLAYLSLRLSDGASPSD